MCATLAANSGCGENRGGAGGAAASPGGAPAGGKRVLVSSLAGRWYPAGREALAATIRDLLPRPAPPRATNVCAALVPHAGYQFSGGVAAAVLARIDPAACDRVVILGPSHHFDLRNTLSVPDATHIRTPLGEAPLDTAFLERLRRLDGVIVDSRVHDREHSVQIQIPLLQVILGEHLRIVPVVVGQMTPAAAQAFSRRLQPLLDSRTLVLVSSDFTHYGPGYGYVPFTVNVERRIAELDRRVFARFAAGDLDGFWQVLEETGATVCGRCPMAVLMGMLPPGARVTEVAYDTSGRMLGDWENSVGYLGAIVEGVWPSAGGAAETAATEEEETVALPPEARAQLLKLARATLEKCVRGGAPPSPREAGVSITPPLEQVMGGFVTLTIDGVLRGCIGEILPRRPIWQVVREQTVNAALHDPRFPPVTPAETKGIRIEISALTPPRPVASWREIVVGRHGVVMSRHGRSAVFLPQVAPEQGWDLPTMLTHLARKAGLPDDAWREGAEFLVFEAEVFREAP